MPLLFLSERQFHRQMTALSQSGEDWLKAGTLEARLAFVQHALEGHREAFRGLGQAWAQCSQAVGLFDTLARAVPVVAPAFQPEQEGLRAVYDSAREVALQTDQRPLFEHLAQLRFGWGDSRLMWSVWVWEGIRKNASQVVDCLWTHPPSGTWHQCFRRLWHETDSADWAVLQQNVARALARVPASVPVPTAWVAAFWNALRENQVTPQQAIQDLRHQGIAPSTVLTELVALASTSMRQGDWDRLHVLVDTVLLHQDHLTQQRWVHQAQWRLPQTQANLRQQILQDRPASMSAPRPRPRS